MCSETDQEIVKELRAIRNAIAAAGDRTGICVLLFLIFLAVGPCRPQPPPPETRHGLALSHTPVLAAASRGSDQRPCRREPVCKTLTETSERPRPSRDNRAIPEWFSLMSRGPG